MFSEYRVSLTPGKTPHLQVYLPSKFAFFPTCFTSPLFLTVFCISLTLCVCTCVWSREEGGFTLSRYLYLWVGRWYRRGEESLSVFWNSWHHSVEPICRTVPERKWSWEIWNLSVTNTHADTFSKHTLAHKERVCYCLLRYPTGVWVPYP